MLPYFPQPVFPLGPLRIHAFALFAVAAILVARWIVVRRARKVGIGYAEIVPFYLAVIIAGLAGSIIGGFVERGGLSSMGTVVGGLAGAWACCWVRRYPWSRTLMMLDIGAFAGPFAGAIFRIGCTIAHDHRGRFSDSWLAFRFPEGSRYDLGFIDCLFLIVLCLAFLIADRKPKPAGYFLGLSAFTYGAFRVWRFELDVMPKRLPWAILCLGGGAVLICLWTGIARRGTAEALTAARNSAQVGSWRA